MSQNPQASRPRVVQVATNWTHPNYAADFPNLGFEVITGVVYGSSSQSSTYVSGGRNYVSSQVDVSREFFVRRDGDGVSVPFTFINRGFTLCDGQRISVIHAYVAGRGAGLYVRLINHDTERRYVVADTPDVCVRLGFSQGGGGALSAGLAWGSACFLISLIPAGILLRIPEFETLGGICLAAGFLGSPVLALVFGLRAQSRSSSIVGKLGSRLDLVAEHVLAHVVRSRRG